jgi:hypothetical protein
MQYAPWYASTLHIVGQRDVIGPNIELPLAQPEDSAVHASWVDADPHVDVDACHVTHQSVARPTK